MNSFVMTGKEASVLFGLMAESVDLSHIPVGSRNLTDVSEGETAAIAGEFVKAGLLDGTAEYFRPDKGLETFLKPIVTAETVMIFNQGQGKKCSFNATLYFSKSGTAVLLDQERDVKFLTMDFADDVVFFLPEISSGGEDDAEKPYISYILYQKERSTIHAAVLDPASGQVRVTEGIRRAAEKPQEAELFMDQRQYQNRLFGTVKEVWDVSCR